LDSNARVGQTSGLTVPGASGSEDAPAAVVRMATGLQSRPEPSGRRPDPPHRPGR